MYSKYIIYYMDFEEIIEGRTPRLGGSSPTVKELTCCTPMEDPFFVEITIAHPHTASYLKMNSEQQKKRIAYVFRQIICAIPTMYHMQSQIFFEYTKTGQIHGHGWLKTTGFKHYPIGAISDMAKAGLATQIKKYSKFCDKDIYPEWIVYKSYFLKLKYDLLTSDRVPIWEAYCRKLQ